MRNEVSRIMANPVAAEALFATKDQRPLISHTASTLVANQATTATTQTTPWGFATQAQGDALATKINAILAVLIAHGLMKDA